MKPVLLTPNQPTQFYRGGPAIAAFRGDENDAVGDFGPEDWIASTVNVFGTADGVSVLPDGRLLRDAIATEPATFVGEAHYAAYGADPALLVKLLDAGERLPVHVHPDQAFAARHLDCRHGKTEAWIVLDTAGTNAAVYLGFRESVSPELVARWVAEQDSAVILGAMNRLPVAAGDTVLVPAGTPHAIGAGVFVIELQEPTDFSVMLEWKQFGMTERETEQLGLATSLALTCVDTSGWDADRLASCVTRGAFDNQPGTHSLFPTAADPFFRAEQIGARAVDAPIELTPQFAVLVVVEGAGRLEFTGGAIDIARGQTVLVPHSAGPLRIRGNVSVVRCLPPTIG